MLRVILNSFCSCEIEMSSGGELLHYRSETFVRTGLVSENEGFGTKYNFFYFKF